MIMLIWGSKNGCGGTNMDNMFYEEITQEESFKYVNHYFSIYKTKIKQHNVDFNSHYDYDCNFDNPFFENIVFGNDYFLNLFAENQQQLIKTGSYNLEEVFQLNEQYKEVVLEKFKKDFKEEFAREYISKIDDILKEYKRQLKYASEDKRFYENREYLGKEDTIGGPVSEEERVEGIEDAKERQELYANKIQLFESAKDSVSTIITHAMFV